MLILPRLANNSRILCSTTIIRQSLTRPPTLLAASAAGLTIDVKPRSGTGVSSRPMMIHWRDIHCSRPSSQTIRSRLQQLPQIWKFIKTKYAFNYVKRKWDPDFSEGGFIYGTMAAICRICQIIKSNNLDELNGLLTEEARNKVLKDVVPRLTDQQKETLPFHIQDIRILVPSVVNINKKSKMCKVILRSIALKWLMRNSRPTLILVAIESGFQRDFNDIDKPEWTINSFEVLEFIVIGKIQQMPPPGKKGKDKKDKEE